MEEETQWPSAFDIPSGWRRAAVDTRDGPVCFQLVDVAYSMERVQSSVVEPMSGTTPVVSLIGTDERGTSVIARVYNFFPYFYCPAPHALSDDELGDFAMALDAALRQSAKLPEGEPAFYVRSVDIVPRMNVMFYTENPSPYLRITLGAPKLVAVARQILAGDIERVGPCATFESDVAFDMRFLIDMRMVGAGWVELPAGSYEDVTRMHEFGVNYVYGVAVENVVAHAPTGEWLRMAPLRTLSFDIECAAQRDAFPDPRLDPVIQIATIVVEQGRTIDQPLVRTIFTLDTCTAIPGADVRCFQSESEMLLAWSNLVVATDPDILTGFNVNNFDFPYLLDRASHLRVGKEFAAFGRTLRERLAYYRDAKNDSNQTGKHDNRDICILGRVVFDAFQVIRRDYKLRSYTLNAVSAHFLKEQKEDVHHSIITTLQNGTPDDRRRLAVYCLKDALLPLRLLDRLMSFVNYVEMARVTGVPLNYLLTRGQQVKVLSQIYRYASAEGIIIPFKEKTNHIVGTDNGKGYEGAVVIDPKPGFYGLPVATLDFASLYPSIMMAHNLCYTTLVSPSQHQRAAEKLGEQAVTRTPNGDMFVRPSVKKGLLPRILEELIAARKQAKGDMGKEKDPFRKAVLDGRQLALKVVCNSVYGFTGAQIGKLPCLEISASVTSFGREMILRTKAGVMEHFSIKNGYAHNADVIYGDTDSVMVVFGVQTVVEAMELGKKGADYVTTFFQAPIKLEFEKVYFPYLLLGKKRYAGLYWTKPVKPDYMDRKGLESVRRDSCKLVSFVVDKCLRLILEERSPDSAIRYVREVVSDLVQNRIDISLLIISKTLRGEYKSTPPAHAVLAKRMKERDPGSAPHVGDRVPYVIVQGTKKARAFERVEHPLYVLENNIPIDVNYYIDNQLRGPLERIFKPLLENVDSLFVGEHTRRIVAPAEPAGLLGRLVVRQATCIGCRGRLPSEDAPLCARCMPMAAEIYLRESMRASQLQSEFSLTWTNCQRCQGSMEQPVMCTNCDCSMFYIRTKIQKDLQGAMVTLRRLDTNDW